MKNKKTHWLRFTLIVLVICALCGGVLAATRFQKDFGSPYATSSIQFSFDGAAEGMAPNGTRFDISGLTSDTVLEEALETSGLKGQLNADQVRRMMVVTGVYPGDIQEQLMNYESVLDFNANRALTIREYHPTQYTVTLSLDEAGALSRSQLEGLLANIMNVYKRYFCKTSAYGVHPADIAYDMANFDYPQQLAIISDFIGFSAEYAQELYLKEPTLRVNGLVFNDIYVQLMNLRDNDINRLNARITMNALSTKPERLLTQYRYIIKNLQSSMTYQNAQMQKVDALLASYEKNESIYLATAETLTKIDGNASETYDHLVDRRKALADEISDIQSQINLYQLRIADLTGQQNTVSGNVSETTGIASAATATPVRTSTGTAAQDPEQSATLEEEIQNLLDRRAAILADFAALINAYNAQELNDTTVTVSNVKYISASLLSGSFIRAFIKTAGPICAVGFMLCLVLIIISRIREEKDDKKRKKHAPAADNA